MTPDQITALVTEGCTLDRQIAAREMRLKEIKAALVKLPPGTYTDGAGHSAQVIQPSPGIKPDTSAIGACQQLLGVDDAGKNLFRKLFDRLVLFKPVKDFRAVAAAVLTPAKFDRVISLCEKPASPYVLFR